jgi:hypothetical protein
VGGEWVEVKEVMQIVAMLMVGLGFFIDWLHVPMIVSTWRQERRIASSIFLAPLVISVPGALMLDVPLAWWARAGIVIGHHVLFAAVLSWLVLPWLLWKFSKEQPPR